jgi:hypothetical protein
VKKKFQAAAMVLGSLAGIAGCASNNAGDVASDTRSALLAGRVLSEGEVAKLARNSGFPEAIIGSVVCTAKYESRFFERAESRNRNGSVDRGVLQINDIHYIEQIPDGCPPTVNDLFDAEANVQCAFSVYRAAQGTNVNPRVGLTPWFGYKSHKAECDGYPAPASTEGT